MLMYPPRLNGVDMMAVRDDVLGVRLDACRPGDYPWDRWAALAETARVPPSLAALGRAVFREAYQHNWPLARCAEAGWADGGARMLCHALAYPNRAAARWAHLMGEGTPASPLTDDPLELCYALQDAGAEISGLMLPPRDVR